MAARYAAGFSSTVVAATNQPVMALINTSTTQRLRVMQIAVGVGATAGAAPSFYISRATARGTQTTSLAGQPFDGNDAASIGALDYVWSVNPTFSTSNQFTRGGLSTTAGGWWIWDFRDYPITIPATSGSGIVVANSVNSTSGTLNGHIVWEE